MKSQAQRFILALALFLMPASLFADKIVVTGNNVRLRMSPSTKASTLIYLDTGLNVHVNKGDVLECYGHSNGFCKVYYSGHQVWISSKFTRHLGGSSSTGTSGVSKTSKGYHPDWVTVQGNDVRLRKSASLNGQVYGKVNRGTRLRCIGASGNFWQVNYQGNYLYISKDFAF